MNADLKMGSKETKPYLRSGLRVRVRWKLTIVLLLLALLVGATIAFLTYSEARAILFRQIQSKVLSIAATGATQIDGDLHELIGTGDGVGSRVYDQIQRTLRRFRDANRRSDVRVRFVYTMRPINHENGDWEYVVDAEEPGPDHSDVGDIVIFESKFDQKLTLEKEFADEGFTTDEFGVWLSGNAPIYNSAGRPVALLGVDLAAGDVLARMRRLIYASASALLIGMLTAVGLALVVARWATKPLGVIRYGLKRIGEGDLEHRVPVQTNDEFGDVAAAVNQMANELREREILKGTLTRYVSQDVVNQVLADREMPALRGQRREITVLIADIREFTALSQRIPPEELVSFLNRYLERMIEIVLRNRGTLDKFLGDGILAIFGAPLDDENHRIHALQSSQEMLHAVDHLQEYLRATANENLRIGIALHCGHAVVGNIGSEKRMEYTAIGDVVNVTSRIEALNKVFGTEILVSEAVEERIRGHFRFSEVGAVQLRGVSGALKVFTLPRLDTIDSR